MKVTTLLSEPFSANVHVVECGDDVLLVDAGTGVDQERVHARLRQVAAPERVKRIFVTHWHCDHCGGAAGLKGLTGAEVCMHATEAKALESGDQDATLARWAGFRVPACPVTPVKEGDVLEVGDRRFEVLLVPGHSPGHAALFEPESRSLFAGDLAFPLGSFGRVDFPGGDPSELIRSLERVSALDALNLYPGHMEAVEGGARDALRWSLESAREMLG